MESAKTSSSGWRCSNVAAELPCAIDGITETTMMNEARIMAFTAATLVRVRRGRSLRLARRVGPTLEHEANRARVRARRHEMCTRKCGLEVVQRGFVCDVGDGEPSR